MADLLFMGRGANDTPAPSTTPRTPASRRRAAMTTLAEWLMLAWALWWSWAYVQSALAQRFPQWLGWTTRLW